MVILFNSSFGIQAEELQPRLGLTARIPPDLSKDE